MLKEVFIEEGLHQGMLATYEPQYQCGAMKTWMIGSGGYVRDTVFDQPRYVTFPWVPASAVGNLEVAARALVVSAAGCAIGVESEQEIVKFFASWASEWTPKVEDFLRVPMAHGDIIYVLKGAGRLCRRADGYLAMGLIEPRAYRFRIPLMSVVVPTRFEREVGL